MKKEGVLKATVALIILVISGLSLAYGFYLMVVIAIFNNPLYAVLVLYLILTGLIGTGSIIRTIYE